MVNYGLFLQNGRAVEHDLISAARYYKMSADNRNSEGMRRYACCLCDGVGVEKDVDSAARYYKMAVELGDASAMFDYAVLLVGNPGSQRDTAPAERYFRMAAESADPCIVWRAATVLMEGCGVPKDEETARRCLSRLESSTSIEGLAELAHRLRYGWGTRVDVRESLRWSRRCVELGDVPSLACLGLCYEKGIGVEADLIEAANWYERASELGSRTGTLSLGVFHWRGIGGFSVDRREALRLWRLGGLEVPESEIAPVSIQAGDESARLSRFCSSTPDLDETRMSGRAVADSDLASGTGTESIRRDSDSWEASSSNRLFRSVTAFQTAEIGDRRQSAPDSDSMNPLAPRSADLPERASDSFALSHSRRMIGSLLLADNQSVPDFLGEEHPAGEIARLAGEGIRREGLRCLKGGFEGEQGTALCREMIECQTIESLLRMCAVFYTRNTFLYRRVNEFLRLAGESDAETGRNLGLYVGLLRECFCVSGGCNPLLWESPKLVYRGADLPLDTLVDYARRPEEWIRWPGFTSSSRLRSVALDFPGNVLFEVSLTDPVPSLNDISAFKNEEEFILSPYQWFELDRVRWDPECGRWIVTVGALSRTSALQSWFPSRLGDISIPI
jgi:TPR repeat protein